jgi:hypothetical protein
MLGRFEEASTIVTDAGRRWRDLTDDSVDLMLGLIAGTAGDHQQAVAHFRRYCDPLEAHGRRNLLTVCAPLRGRSLCAPGRYGEAESTALLGRELGNDHDVYAQVLWRQVQALVHASRRQLVEAEAVAREAAASQAAQVRDRVGHFERAGPG